MKCRREIASLVALLALGVGAAASGVSWADDSLSAYLGGETLSSRQDHMGAYAPANSSPGIAFTGELLGGREDGSGVGSAYGDVTLPLPSHLGVDIETLSYDSSADKFTGGGVHLYWRNPNIGMIGAIASVSTMDIGQTVDMPELTGIRSETYGIEGEVYLGPVAAAVQASHVQSTLAFYDQASLIAVDVSLAATRRWYWLAGTRRIAGEVTNRLETGYTLTIGGKPIMPYAGGTWGDFDGQYLGAKFALWTGANSRWVGFIEFDRGEQSYEAGFLGISYEFGAVANAPMISLFDRVTGAN